MTIKETENPKVLYHYCSMENFLSIIHNKNLRLTDSQYTNDSYENVWIIERIKNVLKEYSPDSYKKLGPLLQYIQLIERGAMPMPYIACFSEVGDLLSQWRAYADDGNGVAIGFEVLIPRKLPNFYAGSDVKGKSLTLHQVIYDLKNQDAELNKIFNCVLENGDEVEVSKYGNYLKSLSYIYKHPAFSEEKEWRIMNSILFANDYNSVGAISQLFFTTKKNRLISYLKMPIGGKDRCCEIKEVVLGPKNTTTFKTLNHLLEVNDFHNVKISRSSAPYR